MRFIIVLLFMVIMAGLFLAGAVYVIARSLGHIMLHPGSKVWNRTVDRLRARIAAQRARLVPWDREMLSLLSLNRTDVTKPGFWSQDTSGIFNSIYHEPVLVYAQLRSGKNALVVAQTSNREYVFRQKEKETEVWLNGQPLGVYVNGAFLAPGKSSTLMAQVDIRPDESQFPVVLRDKTVGALTNPAHSSSPNPRTISLLRTDLSPEEESVVLALAVLSSLRSE